MKKNYTAIYNKAADTGYKVTTSMSSCIRLYTPHTVQLDIDEKTHYFENVWMVAGSSSPLMPYQMMGN